MSLGFGEESNFRKFFFRLAGLFLFALASSDALSDKKANILLVASKSTPAYVEVLRGVTAQLQENQPEAYDFNFIYRPTPADLQTSLPGLDYIVTVGTSAAETTYKLKPEVPVISVLITEDAFSTLAKKHYGSVENAFATRVSSVCIDQPVARSIQLAKLIIPGKEEIGIMLGPSSIQKKEWLEGFIKDISMRPKFVAITASDNPIHKIEPVLSRSDVFVPISDSRLINIATAKWILHLSYRHKVPVIAFSKSYLKAGALAAIYSSPADVAQDTVDWFEKYGAGKKGGLYKPNHYSLEFNQSVAANLKVDLKAQETYRQQLNLEAR